MEERIEYPSLEDEIPDNTDISLIKIYKILHLVSLDIVGESVAKKMLLKPEFHSVIDNIFNAENSEEREKTYLEEVKKLDFDSLV